MSPCCDHAEGRSAALQATVGRPPGNPDLTDDEAYRAGERDQQAGDSGDNQHWDYHPPTPIRMSTTGRFSRRD